MKRVRLNMVGNSHIDPVWFWGRDEGMQEVKATFLSALARMEEYDGFIFTASSSAFYEYMEEVCPDAFEELRRRVREGRWEITGGWYIEADACLPCGESLIRQALYGRKYFREKFGVTSRVAFAPDTFGHTETMPMLLKGCGMDFHAHQRPAFNGTALRRWAYKDGSSVVDFQMPSSYTLWFEDQFIEAVNQCADAAEDGGRMACFYGVGNHGGGPTKENIELVIKNASYTCEAGTKAELAFSRLDSFIEGAPEDLPCFDGEIGSGNRGYYLTDFQLKQAVRRAERSLIRAEKLCVMAELLGVKPPRVSALAFEALWKKVLFNQFHDTICGTAIKPARDRAVEDCGFAVSGAAEIENMAVQAVVNAADTRGEGFPLFLFNPNLQPYDGYVETEVSWFCKAHLLVLDGDGAEVPYQRVKTLCSMVNYNLGGVRRLVFRAKLPPFGYGVYRLVEREPGFDTDTGAEWIAAGLPVNASPHVTPGAVGLMGGRGLPPVIENERIRVSFSEETGLPEEFTVKDGGFSPVGGAWLELFNDNGNSWGWKPGELAPDGERLRLKELRLLENGSIRKTVKAVCVCEELKAEILYTLYKDDDKLHCDMRLFNARPRAMLSLRVPFKEPVCGARAQIPYGVTERAEDESVFRLMHDFVDVYGANGGLAVFNGGCFAYRLNGGLLDIPLFRSCIYSQSDAKGWYSDNADYDHADMGRVTHRFAFLPHRGEISDALLFKTAEEFNQPPVALMDTHHESFAPSVFCGGSAASRGLLSCPDEDISLGAAKLSEDGGQILARVLNLSAGEKRVALTTPFGEAELKAAPFGLASAKLSRNGCVPCNHAEENEI